jgi:hypothetical protein
MSYIVEPNLRKIREDPNFFTKLWDGKYDVPKEIRRDLGETFECLTDEGFLAAFAGVTAYDLTPYGAPPHIPKKFSSLKEILALPINTCDIYCVVAALLFRQARPTSKVRLCMAGWIGGALINHAQLFVEGVGAPLLIDPTIKAVAIASYEQVKAGNPISEKYFHQFSYKAKEGFGSDVRPRIRNALLLGQVRPKDASYHKDAEKYGAEPQDEFACDHR